MPGVCGQDNEDSVGNVSWNQFLFFIYKNKQWTVVYRKQNINLLGDTCDNLLIKIGRVFVLK